ncbi:hypothetical protein [Streptomyces sp. NBC_00212]|uniref:hypothetical protein n=1 Tax=Streptomyces sp. NBC_00212 TaxID=2975684 RepID=UPI00324A5274
MSADLGLLHESHLWLGQIVTDTATERHGELRAIAPDLAAQPVAWLRPVGGGREWTTSLYCLADPEPVTPGMDPPEGQ